MQVEFHKGVNVRWAGTRDGLQMGDFRFVLILAREIGGSGLTINSVETNPHPTSDPRGQFLVSLCRNGEVVPERHSRGPRVLSGFWIVPI